MKKPWYAWVGQFLLLALAIIAALGKLFGLQIPWASIIVPTVTWLADFFVGLVPSEGWAKAVGKILLIAVSTVELTLSQLGVQLAIWPIVGAFIVSIADYLIGLVPREASA